MTVEADILRPLKRRGGRRMAVEVYDVLQDAILSGRLEPGAILSQVDVADALQVSRTPVREAMRKLQEAGLVTGEPNVRSRVLSFNPKDVEALYMKRIMMESLGVAVTTRLLTPPLLEQLHKIVDSLEDKEAQADFTTWQERHRELHRLIVSKAGETYVTDLEMLGRRSERYQACHKGQHQPGWWVRGMQEHRALFNEIAVGDAAKAGELAARHLARTALELLARLAPEYDTSRLRMSLQFAIAGMSATKMG